MSGNGVLIQGDDSTTGEKVSPKITNDALHVSSLARNGVLQGAGVYNNTEILGYRVLAPGTGAWSITLIDGAPIAIPVTAVIAGEIVLEHLSSITVGTGGSAILYTPS